MIAIAAGVSLLISLTVSLLMMRVHRNRLRRQAGVDKTLEALREELEALVRDVNGITERNILLIENRIQAAKELMDQISRATSAQHRDEEARQAAEKAYAALGRNRPLDLRVEDDDVTLDNPSPIDLPNSSQLKESGEPSGKGTTSGSPQKIEQSSLMDFENLSPRQKALVLHRQGESSDHIASRLNMSRGEVNLIISLHDRRR